MDVHDGDRWQWQEIGSNIKVYDFSHVYVRIASYWLAVWGSACALHNVYMHECTLIESPWLPLNGCMCECVWVAQNNHFITRYKICIFVFADKQTTAEWIRNYERNMKEWKVILFSVWEHLKWDSGMWLLLSTYTNIDEHCVHHQH